MRAPAFWTRDGWLPRLLAPLGALTARSTARRVARPGWRAPVPVICCGNATVGGAGKTTLAIDLIRRLRAMGHAPHALTRGHGGAIPGPHRVGPDDTARDVGDEALLLAAECPAWVGADRGETARRAVEAGATVLVMDDGLQNPSLEKDIALLVVDGASGFGNGRPMPAGPLREPVARAAARCAAAVLIGADASGALAALPPGLPVLRARLVQDSAIAALRGRRIAAFAGIARPSKFFDPLREAGADVVAAIPFPDHHAYSPRELIKLLRAAGDAQLATTPKDAVRLPPEFRALVAVVGVGLEWDDPGALDALLPALKVR